jgi:hypothetical protein
MTPRSDATMDECQTKLNMKNTKELPQGIPDVPTSNTDKPCEAATDHDDARPSPAVVAQRSPNSTPKLASPAHTSPHDVNDQRHPIQIHLFAKIALKTRYAMNDTIPYAIHLFHHHPRPPDSIIPIYFIDFQHPFPTMPYAALITTLATITQAPTLSPRSA